MEHGAEVGGKAKGAKSEDIEGSRGGGGEGEVFLSRGMGADDAFYATFVPFLLELSGSMKSAKLEE